MMVCVFAKGQSVAVSGLQSGTWEADTIHVTGDVQVADTLVILAGTTVLFDGFYKIEVADGAVLTAHGSETDSVVFTVADTTGFYVYNSGDGGWNGFHLDNAGSVLLDHCVLQYGKAADTLDRWGGALYINRCKDIVVSNTTFRCNFSREQGGAVYGLSSNVVMSDCSVVGNGVFTGDNLYARYGGGLQFLNCDVSMTGMSFHANLGSSCIGGALSLDSCSVFLDRAVFTDNVGINGGGMYIMRCNHKECRLSNLLFDGNVSGHFAGGLAFKDASPDVSNVLVVNNDSEGVSCSGMFFFEHSSPRLSNCIVYGNYPHHSMGVPDTVQMWVWTFDDDAPEFRNCLIEGGLERIRGYEYIKVFEEVIDTDPRFVDPAGKDFHLKPDSPCVDAGAASTPQYVLEGLDLDGNPRVVHQRIDIGPYECLTAALSMSDDGLPFARLEGNPLGVRSRLVVDLDREDEVKVALFAITGRCVTARTYGVCAVGRNELMVGDLVGDLAPGVYLMEVCANGKRCVLKTIR